VNAKEALQELEAAAQALKKTADAISSGLPALGKELADGTESRRRLDESVKLLAEAERKVTELSDSLAGIEGAVLQAMGAAKEGLHNSKLSVDSRLEMLRITQSLFSKMAAAGFHITIPSIGDKLDGDLHAPKGKAKSLLGKGDIADVISWGYRFPSGTGQLAEVLVGDGSLTETEEQPAAGPPSPKAGISMVVEEEPQKASAPRKPKKASDTLFDHLAEAAEKNRQS
jgi:hypothetical protein